MNVAPAQPKRRHTQIFLLLAFTDHSPPDWLSNKFGGRRLASTKKGGRVGGVRLVSLRLSTAPARERGLYELVRTRSRLTPHQSPNIPSAAAPEPPAVFALFAFLGHVVEQRHAP